ncbi:YqjF family protein [Mesobacillus harenae]|uniref:YqjF family protein n=1 Tax=Mesobacillus harenae TaxID=2213203 RepID=UPI001580DFA3|nr:DUF2071 domain-containing protein [Mesobacillus harenae]
MYEELLNTNHRTHPLPSIPWIMTQVWENTAFFHWPIPKKTIRDNVPHELEIDSFNGNAWIGIVPFRVSEMRVRFLPKIPFMNSFNELNLRTYVTFKGVPGVYFFTLDANHPVVAGLARVFYGLPYNNAELTIQNEKDFLVIKSGRNNKKGLFEFQGSYRPSSSIFLSEVGSMEEFLTERYCLWTKRGNKLFRADIHHTKWELQKAEAEVLKNTIGAGLSSNLFASQPVFHYCKYKRAFFWPLIPEHV